MHRNLIQGQVATMISAFPELAATNAKLRTLGVVADLTQLAIWSCLDMIHTSIRAAIKHQSAMHTTHCCMIN